MAGETATLTDNHGVTLHTIGSGGPKLGQHNWASLEGWFGGVSIRLRGGEPRLGDGDFPGRINRSGRTLTLSGWSEFATVEDMRSASRLISGLFAPEDHVEGATLGRLRVQLDRDLTAAVRLDGTLKVVESAAGMTVDWEIPLYAPDPHLYGPNQRTPITMSGSNSLGLFWPLFAPDGVLDFDGDGTTLMLTNSGNAPAYPRITIEGDYPGGFAIILGGRSVQFQAPTYRQSPVVVDMRGFVTVRGVDRSSYLTVREWTAVPPHGSLPIDFVPLKGGTGLVTATIQDTYL